MFCLSLFVLVIGGSDTDLLKFLRVNSLASVCGNVDISRNWGGFLHLFVALAVIRLTTGAHEVGVKPFVSHFLLTLTPTFSLGFAFFRQGHFLSDSLTELACSLSLCEFLPPTPNYLKSAQLSLIYI